MTDISTEQNKLLSTSLTSADSYMILELERTTKTLIKTVDTFNSLSMEDLIKTMRSQFLLVQMLSQFPEVKKLSEEEFLAMVGTSTDPDLKKLTPGQCKTIMAAISDTKILELTELIEKQYNAMRAICQSPEVAKLKRLTKKYLENSEELLNRYAK